MADAKDTRPGASKPIPTVDQIRWADSPRPNGRPWYRTPLAGMLASGTAILAVGLGLPRFAAADPELGRKAPAACMAVTVQRGDTVWRIAESNSLTLDTVATLNPHIANLSRIYPGDEIAVTCDPQGVALAIPQSVVRRIDVERFRNIYEADGVLSWESIIAELYRAGFRGEDLVTMAAIVPGESGRRPAAIGDMHLANATWDGSFGIAQVRALRAQEGTGGPRDAVALRSSVEHQAYGAYEVFKSQNFRAWTVYLKGWHVGHLGTARATAERMGLL